ncbi:3-oxoadipyl-CoA thiolase [Vibrio natriegens]|uniref:Beta-ketoadipyl-CoA thiolase n=1 Tax=Vibrio natriegens NBRC 15636 = ATCC 14048 = DSM 759 TaxID=1219067 RepID=A0AAN1CY90_VIBNA|nr:3-oxoadipyl-CoA thiolase [Vibrio natriegens]ALR17916.1 beta-ketoadipyl CoA thiolase [Vibrio natriegens NBRC 15636 = ATCC 14048 = DSM 759]ANQ15409.1 3-oxoadipyl-CoA thiolase [Vibrio natriegens NBRC 15636 = ATCC 14048 = DSM 759]EPM41118.1 acetyl-CoA acetyltransferase [Vibrio natriegens NBRC 15636 = ATCC 14048 = DSM 759]MDX6029233.1 3-oxoadipyl-CoA thiolase [Vibrio natriegens NBRC 15636 = ATCC 14048 = DSM 759]UUI14060.1 3-oxoadipyl-CoA thiolase [Vibrio natriegens]
MTNVYLCNPRRSAIGRFGGTLASVRPDDLAAQIFKAVLEQVPNMDPAAIDEVIMGSANQAGEDNRNVARMSALLAGLPTSVPGTTINRLCGSGMDAVGTAFRAIKAGEMDLVLAGGVESMSRAPYVMGKADSAFTRTQQIEDTTIGWRFVNPLMKQLYGVDSMPETAENVAETYHVSREDQDLFAFRSQKKAQQAITDQIFAQEIVPIEIQRKRQEPLIFDTDEHPRPSTLEKLASLPTPFRNGGSVTAGNASGVNDGAAAMLVASEDAVSQHSLTPVAKILGMATAGVEPRVMGIGPVPAVKKLLEKHRISIQDIDVIELNEAFAAQGLAVLRELGIEDDDPRVNPNGGAIALGHPLGMSGARLLMTAALQLQRTGGRYALCTMCVGVGQGIATLIERA